MATLTVTVAGTDRTANLCAPNSGTAATLNEALRERKRFNCSFVSPTGAWWPERGQHIAVEHSTDGAKFGGYITNVTRRKSAGSSAIFADVTCVSYEQIASRRRAAAFTYKDTGAGAIFEQIGTGSLGGEGFTFEVESGPTIPLFDIQEPRPTTGEAWDRLCELASNGDDIYYWEITPAKVVRFFKQDTYPAPFSITDAHPYVLGTPGEYASVNETNQGIVNRVFVFAGQYLRDAVTEDFVGDSATRTWDLAYPCGAKPAITVNGVDIGDFIGVDGADTGLQWYWTLGSTRIRQDDLGTLLGPGDTISVTYQGSDKRSIGPFDDADSASAEGVLQGDGTGVYEGYLQIETPHGASDVETLAQAFLDRFSKATVTFKGATFTAGLRSGQELVVNLTDLAINLTMLVQSVTMTDVSNGHFLWSFTAIFGAARDDWKRALVGKSPSPSIVGVGAGAVPVPGADAAVPDAPNVTATHGSVTATLDAHITVAEFHETINLPTTDPNYAAHFHAVVMFFVPAGTDKEIELARFTKPASGTTISVVASSREIPLTASVQSGNKLRFKVYNENYTESPTPYELTGISLPAMGVSSVSASDSTGDRWVDGNRSVYAPQSIAIACAIYPQNVSILRYDGTKNHLEGWFTILGSVTLKLGLKGSKELIFAPPANQTWTMRVVAGTWEGNDTDGWRNLDAGLGPYAVGSIPGIVSSSPYSVAQMSLPAAGLITSITVAAGAGGAFPYNLLYPDGQQGFSIPYVSVDASAAFLDPNTFTVVFTAEDLDAAGNSIGPEHVWGTPEVVNDIISMGPLDGPYGDKADPARSGIVAKVRIKVYCCNRYNDTTAAWQDTTNSSRFQASTTITIATTAPYVPTGAIPGSRVAGAVANATTAGTAVTVPSSGIFGSINLGGGGALVPVMSVKNASGTVIAQFGQFGTLYGLWTQNFWVGTGGPGPLGAKLWIDSSGNIQMLGLINSGSTITGAAFVGGSLSIVTANGTVSVSSSQAGVVCQNGAINANLYPGFLSVGNGTNQSVILPTLITSLGFAYGVVGVSGPLGGTVLDSSERFVGRGLICPNYTVNANRFSIGPTDATAINAAREWVGSHVNIPTSSVICNSVQVGSGGLFSQGSMGVTAALGLKVNVGGTDYFVRMILNGVDVGAVRFNFVGGVYCGLF